MTVSLTHYGTNNNYWNAGPQPIVAKDILVNSNSNSNTLNLTMIHDGRTFTGTLSGNFQFNGPISTVDKVSGTFTESTFYKNGVLYSTEIMAQPVEIHAWVWQSTSVPAYIHQASILNRGVTFVGSQGSTEYGDTLIAGSGNDSFTSYPGKVTKGLGAYFDGQGGTDTAILQGLLSEYTIRTATFWDQTDRSGQAPLKQISGWEIVKPGTSRNEVTQLANVERVQFADKTIAFDLSPDQAGGTPTPTPPPTQTFQTTNTLAIPPGRAINSSAANDLITGTSSTTDAVSYSGSIRDYRVAKDANGNHTVIDTVTNRNGSDVVVNVERLQFSPDPSTGANRIALDLAPTQATGKATLLIGAVLPGKLALDPSKYALMGPVIDLFDQGFTLQQLSGALLRLPIWDVLTGKGAPTNADIATYLVNNVYGVGTGQTANLGADLARSLAIDAMAAETPATQGTYLANLVLSATSQSHIDLVGIQSTGLVYLG